MSGLKFKHKYYPESKFTGFTRVDGTLAFYLVVNTLGDDEDFTILDYGCGRAVGQLQKGRAGKLRENLRNFKGRVKKVIGVDVDEDARDNPSLDEFHLIVPDQKIPVADSSVDLVISDYVLEHVTNADFYFSEISRVLKPGGHVCIRTVNIWGYIALAARIVPNRLHAKVTAKVQDARKEEDVFPTVYECNSRRAIRKAMRNNGLEDVVYTVESEPAYLSFNGIFYFFGVLYQRIAPSLFKNVIFAFGRKK